MSFFHHEKKSKELLEHMENIYNAHMKSEKYEEDDKELKDVIHTVFRVAGDLELLIKKIEKVDDKIRLVYDASADQTIRFEFNQVDIIGKEQVQLKMIKFFP